jgi:N-acetylmuramoyl-L-alanine amidase
MIRALFILFIFAISMQALSDGEILKRADAFMKTGNKSNQFRAYNDYKSLYLRATIDDDTELKNHSLRGIVKSGNLLHIDVSQYSSKLKETHVKLAYNQPKSKPMKKSEKAQEIHVKSSHKLEFAQWSGSNLILKFDKKLRSDQVKYFTLHNSENKSYRYIFDIDTSMITESHSIKKDGIDKIKLAQFTPDTLRLVIENKSELDLDFIKESNELIVSITTDFPQEATTKVFPSIISNRCKTIVLDPGHGGKDPGAVGYKNYREKIVVFKVAKELEKILKSRGHNVFMTRDSDKFVKLSRRTQYANEKNADIFISIHANAVGNGSAKSANGIECFFLSPSRSSRAKRVAAKENSADMSDMNIYGKDSYLNLLNHHNILASNKLAIDLQRGMLGSLSKKYKHVKDGGVREGPFWVLVGAQMPSVLVEVGFLTHPQEAQRLVDDNYTEMMARGMADGVERYFANN